MPLIHQRTFRVRHYECNADGTLHAAHYLRFMQQAAFEASAAAGYDLARYEVLGRHWLIRETEIEHLRPLRYGDAVRIRTWVADFRRVRSRRAYECHHAASGELVARAATDWVFLDTATGRPAAIPDRMMADFFPEGPPDAAPPRRRFPDAPPPPPGAFERRRRVEWRDIDAARHVNNAVYLAYLEDAIVGALAACGWPPARTAEAGMTLAPARYRIEYRRPALLGDDLTVTVWLSDVEGSAATCHGTVVRVKDDALLVRAQIQLAWVHPASREPALLPWGFLADLAPLVV
jgi:acyl-CoA thioester hydrolase